MSVFSAFTFQRPDLLGVAPVGVLLLCLAVLAQWRRGVRLVDAYGGPGPARRLIGRRLERFPATRLLAAALAVIALTVVAAGPEREVAEEVPVTPVDLVIAVDVSHSMTAADVEPNRMGRAQRLVQEIIDARVADRVALLLFADWSYDLVPLTDDGGVVTFFTPWVTPDLLAARDQGTSLGPLVTHAVATWQARARTEAIPVLLVVSDGEVHTPSGAVLDSVGVAAGAGVAVWTAGVGSGSGAPLFVPGSEAPLLDNGGNAVVARYDRALLEEMADRGGGTFHDISDDAGVRRLLSDLEDLGGRSEAPEIGAPPSMRWALIAALVLLLLDSVLDSGVLTRSGGLIRTGRSEIRS